MIWTKFYCSIKSFLETVYTMLESASIWSLTLQDTRLSGKKQSQKHNFLIFLFVRSCQFWKWQGNPETGTKGLLLMILHALSILSGLLFSWPPHVVMHGEVESEGVKRIFAGHYLPWPTTHASYLLLSLTANLSSHKGRHAGPFVKEMSSHLGFLFHKRLNQVIFWGPLKTGLFYDFMILWYFSSIRLQL